MQPKLSRERKRDYNTDTDSSLGSLDVPAKKVPKKTPEEYPKGKKVKAVRGRKIVSLDNTRGTPYEGNGGLDSSQSTTSIQSTQENEF